MTEILNNSWVTGIGGGIISSLIVFFVTNYIFSKREKREYNQKIETANNEILYSIKPLIIEKKIPTKEILTAVRISIAKKYGVIQEDLHNEFSLSNEFVNEIMANSFLSSDQKLEFCHLLQALKKIGEEPNKVSELEVIYLKEKDSISSKYNSMILALLTFVMTLSMTLLISSKVIRGGGVFLLSDNFTLILTTTLVPIAAVLILYLLKFRNDKGFEQQQLIVKEDLPKEEKVVA